jgi:hypothetical protein
VDIIFFDVYDAGSIRRPLLDQYLVCLAESGASHPQIEALRQVCAKAVSDGCSLTVSGDMYPELWRSDAEQGANGGA